MRNLEENVVLCIELIVLTRWQGAGKRKKKSSHGYFLMNKIIGFENGSKQSDPPPKKTRRTQREVEEEEIWADSHTSDDFTLLTAVGLIVTSPKKRIYFHFRRDGHRRPRRPTRDDLYATEQQDSGGHYTSRSTAGLRRCWLLCVLRMPFW